MLSSEQSQVLLGARVPVRLKENLTKYCFNHGIKMNYLVAQAIREKLMELAEDTEDIVVSKDRLKNDEFISQGEMDGYFKKRGIRA